MAEMQGDCDDSKTAEAWDSLEVQSSLNIFDGEGDGG